MQFDIVNPLEYPHWNELVLATNDYSFFHSAGWAEVLHRSYSYTPAYFTVRDGDRLLALIPVMEVKSFLTGKRGVSLTFTDYCEPIVKERELFNALLERVVEHGRARGWSNIEFRGGQKYLLAAPVFATFLGHTLNLDRDEQQLLAQFRSSTRRNITKAELEGVERRRETSLAAVEEFYRLHCLTRKRHGIPPPAIPLFQKRSRMHHRQGKRLRRPRVP